MNDHPLTERELTILRLSAAGQTQKQIGEYLDVGAQAVNKAFVRIRLKLAAKNNVHAVAMAIRKGLI